MEVRKPVIKSIPYDEFKDNKGLETIVDELHEGGVNVVVGSLDQAINWGRSNSLWSLTFGTSCCGIEFMAVGCARYDFSRFGFEVTRNSPRQADLIMCAGTITNKMAPVFKRLYDEMAEPKYVVAVGGCAISGGPFKNSYNVVRGISEIVPVDVYVPGCPPRPEAILYGMMQLQRKVKVEKFFGGANHKMTHEEKELSMSKGGLHGLSNEALASEAKRETIVVNEVPDSRKTVQIKSDPVGDVRIADEVVAIIAGLAATEVDGVSSMAGNITNEIVSKLGMKNLSKGIMIEIMDNEVKVDVAINIAYGYSIPEVSAKVQDKVKAAIENMTGLTVAVVNVRIASVDMGTDN